MSMQQHSPEAADIRWAVNEKRLDATTCTTGHMIVSIKLVLMLGKTMHNDQLYPVELESMYEAYF